MKPIKVTQNDIKEDWYLIDAKGMRLGRVANVAAELLLGKHNPLTRPNLQPKTKVVVVNAEKLDIPLKKQFQKIYTRYSGFPSGLTTTTLEEMMAQDPRRVVEKAIKGMLPKNSRGNSIYSGNLYVYVGSEHKHEAQQPVQIDIKSFKA